MNLLNLFVDESGYANPKQQESPCYILCGCAINDLCRSQLKIKADQIKFKYWSRTNVIFHSREIGRKFGDFKILKDEKVYKDFVKDLFNFLNTGVFQIFIVVVDKKKAIKRNWNERKVYKETANCMVNNFILSLLAKECRGRLVIESATAEKDFMYHKSAGHYLSNGIKDLEIDYEQVQSYLTEIAFVTKKNHDIEEQIADLLAYGAKLKYLNLKENELTEYDKKILKVLNNKLFAMHPDTGNKKKKFYSKIESFKIIP